MRYELGDPSAFLRRKIEANLSGISLELVEYSCARHAQHIVDFVDLVELIIPWKERK